MSDILANELIENSFKKFSSFKKSVPNLFSFLLTIS